jgi:hypothetical protein
MASYKIMGGDRREYGPASAEQIRQWVTEGRANGDTLVQRDEGAWSKLSSFVEFADLVGPAVPPLALPPPAVGAAIGPTPRSTLGDAGDAVKGPAIALAVVGALDLVMALFGMLAGLMGWGTGLLGSGLAPHGMGDPQLDRVLHWILGPLGMASNAVGLLVNLLIVVGAIRMMTFRNYGWSMAAAILAIVPCTAPCCCLGMAAGIWAVVVLTRPEVKAVFR